MKKLVFLLISWVMIPGGLLAQNFETDLESKSEILKLEFITGNWEGKGWMMGQDGQKHHFDQTENITFKLDSTAILIEGHGEANGRSVHDALAVISFDKESKNYTFTSWLANGRGGQFKAALIDDKFYWYPNENMQYVISLNEKGQWHETGEIRQGDKWFQFFEMTLDRK